MIPFRNVGIVSPGDMGQAVAVALKNDGYAVHTALEGRSARTRVLAAEGGLIDCGSIGTLVRSCDVILSILNPAAAVECARTVAAAIHVSNRDCLFVDCNAVAPQTMMVISDLIAQAGGHCLDAGIIGAPPRGRSRTRVYVSGPGAVRLQQFTNAQMDILVMSEHIGDASALKMCYAAYTKGAVALGIEMLIAARRLGIDAALDQELQNSLAATRDWIIGRTTAMPPKAHRWVPEMLEIAKTFEGAGLTPRILQGAADMYAWIANNSLAKESPEAARAQDRDGRSIIKALADEAGGPAR